MSDTAGRPVRPSPPSSASLRRWTCVAGVVLSVIGVSQDMQELAIVGVLLLLSGGGVMAYVVWQKNKPEAL